MATADDGSTGFFSHLWNNAKLTSYLALDAADHAVGGDSHLAADEAADQLARGAGQPAGATQAQLQAAEHIEDEKGAAGVATEAADATASQIGSGLKWVTGGLVVLGVVVGVGYLVVLAKAARVA